MEVPYCVICIEPLDENDATNPVTKLPGCGHKIHTKCALESAWKATRAVRRAGACLCK